MIPARRPSKAVVRQCQIITYAAAGLVEALG